MVASVIPTFVNIYPEPAPLTDFGTQTEEQADFYLFIYLFIFTASSPIPPASATLVTASFSFGDDDNMINMMQIRLYWCMCTLTSNTFKGTRSRRIIP